MGEWGLEWLPNSPALLSFHPVYFFSLASPRALGEWNLAPEFLSTTFSVLKMILQGLLTALKTDRPPAVLTRNACVS